MRYHLNYTIRRFTRYPNLIDKSSVTTVKKNIPIKPGPNTGLKMDSRGKAALTYAYKEYSSHDYLNFIAKTSNGMTKIGQKLLQESIESCVFYPWGTSQHKMDYSRRRCQINTNPG